MIRVEQTYSQIVKFDLASNGYYGLVYSNDNGKTLHLLVGADGRLFEQKDGDRIWPFIVDKVRSIMRLDWDDVQGKPVLVTKDELDQRLARLNIPSTDGLAKQSDLDNVKATADSATSKAEQAQSTADANTKALQNVYTKEEADQKYWTAEQEQDAESNLNTKIQELIDDKANADDVYTKSEIDIQNASNVKSVNNIEPDDRGNVDIDLIGYAKTSDIPQSMTWSQITGKPNVATKDDVDYLKTLIGSSSGSGDAGLTIEAIVELVKHHLKAKMDVNSGNLLIDVDGVSNGSIADAVATKVAQSLRFKLQSNELVAEIGGTE